MDSNVDRIAALERELAAELARLDWLFKRAGWNADEVRAEVDAAMRGGG